MPLQASEASVEQERNTEAVRAAYHRALEEAGPSPVERAWRQGRFDRGLRLARELEQHLPTLEGLDLLDMGMSHGGDTAALASRGARVTGLDYVDMGMQPLRDELAGLASVQALRADLNRPFPLKDASFDGMISMCVIEHVGDLDRFYAECRRVLRPGGWILLVTPLALRSVRSDAHFHVPLISVLPMRQRKWIAQTLLKRPYRYELADKTFYNIDSVARAAHRQGLQHEGRVYAERRFFENLGRVPGGGIAQRIVRYWLADYVFLRRT